MDSNLYVHPEYKGPMQIQGYLRKVKADKAIGRILRDYDLRYFVLDLNTLSFYYTTDENLERKYIRDLNLIKDVHMVRDVPNVKIDESGHHWFKGFTVQWKKGQEMVLICKSNLPYIQWLNMFEALFSRQQNKAIISREVSLYAMALFYKIQPQKKEVEVEQKQQSNGQAILEEEQKQLVGIEEKDIQTSNVIMISSKIRQKSNTHKNENNIEQLDQEQKQYNFQEQ